MHKSTSLRGWRLLGAVFALGIATTPAFAQMGGRPQGGGGPGGAHGMGGQSACRPERSSEANSAVQPERVTQQLDALRRDLALAPATARLFDDFAAKLNAFMADEAKRRTAAKTLSASALGRLGAALDESSNRYAALEDLHASAKRLFETLDESGRKAFDQLALPTDASGRRTP